MAQPDCIDGTYDPQTGQCTGGSGGGGTLPPDTGGGGTPPAGSCPGGSIVYPISHPNGVCSTDIPEQSNPGGNKYGGDDGGDMEDWPAFFGSRRPDFSFGPAPRFSIEPFKAPSREEIENEPGYAFARDEGRGALDASAAARGDLRSGGHLKNVYSWGNKFAEQNAGNVYNRAGSTWDRLLQAKLAEFSPLMSEWTQRFGANQRAGEMGFDREWNQYLAQLDKYKFGHVSASDLFNGEMNSY